MDGLKTSFLLGWPIFRGYVSFRECMYSSNVWGAYSSSRQMMESGDESTEDEGSSNDDSTHRYLRSIIQRNVHMGVSKNRGTPKSSILIGFSIINHPFWDTPIFGNTHISLFV